MEVLGNGQGLGGFPHRLKNLKNRNGHYSYRHVMEYKELAKSQVMAIRNQSWNFTHFAPKFDQNCAFMGDIKKFSISRESLHFPTFSEKML